MKLSRMSSQQLQQKREALLAKLKKWQGKPTHKEASANFEAQIDRIDKELSSR